MQVEPVEGFLCLSDCFVPAGKCQGPHEENALNRAVTFACGIEKSYSQLPSFTGEQLPVKLPMMCTVLEESLVLDIKIIITDDKTKEQRATSEVNRA